MNLTTSKQAYAVASKALGLPALWLTLTLAGAACDDETERDADVSDAGGDMPAETTDTPADGSDTEFDQGLPTDEVVYTESREPCADRNALRNLYFGDLHIHTRLSFDAWAFDVRTTPRDAYRFALGGEVALPPLGEDGDGTQVVSLDRPLDFAAVTDHSEYLAEIESCVTPGSPAYDSTTCVMYRQGTNTAVFNFGIALTNANPSRFNDICASTIVDCPTLAADVWGRIQDAAEDYYDRTSACEFTTFAAYEYTASTTVSNLHRNVIFRNDVVPEQPVSYFEEPLPSGLWAQLYDRCIDAEGDCDVLAIPHNSNWSNGNLFVVEYRGAESIEDERMQAERRAQLEPLVEIFQHKGDSECMNGLSGILGQPDELCDFEKLRQPPFTDCFDDTGWGAMNGTGCISRLDFVRNVLLEGLREEQRIGVNPYPLGIIASTDTHNGISGSVEEDSYIGHWGNNEDEPAKRLGRGSLNPGGVIYNPGGLAAVWAVENSRDALFEALRRRETYGTSGPRMTVRLFGGWGYPSDLCDDADLVAEGYRGGVPMGGILPERIDAEAAPKLVVSALRDPGTEARPGTPLQRIQIIKGWVDSEGERHQAVFDVAGDPDNGATVDLATCETQGDGFDSLCAVWTDPDFDADQHAFYYARVVENPTCRWSHRQCLAIPQAERPESCDDPTVPDTIQERAWTSPIWYQP